MKIKIVFLFIALASCLNAQNFIPPVPNVSIDTLIMNTRAYKEIYPRSTTETEMRITIEIDSNGVTKTVKFSPIFRDSLGRIDQIFIDEIKPQLEKIQWEPAKSGTKVVNSVYQIPFVLLLKNTSKYLDLFYSGKTRSYHSSIESLIGNNAYSKPFMKVINGPYQIKTVGH